MKTRFSPSAGAFYPFDINYAEVPEDVIEVPLSAFAEAMQRPPGYSFAFVEGALVFSPPPPILFADLAAPRMVSFRENRETALNRLNGLGFSALLAGDTEQAQEIASVRVSLLGIPALPQVQSADTLDGLDAALNAAWHASYHNTNEEAIATAMAVGAGGGQTRPPPP